jgi:aryl-alcohol dehydrogenase-like predicted oxidoreductase
MTQQIPTSIFGKTGQKVTRVGLGGEGILRTVDRQNAAAEIIKTAFDEGITYYDSARVYADSEVYYGSVWQMEGYDRNKIFQTSKSASRDKQGAWADLQGSLARLKTDRLDLWQIHDVRTEDDLRAIGRPGGALEAFIKAKDEGKIRFIGVTGHHDPDILRKAIEKWPVDSVLMPVNPVEGVLGGFMTDTLAAAKEKGIAVIAMKVLGASHYILPKFQVTADLLIRFALSCDIDLAIVGCSTAEEVKTLAKSGRNTKPLSETEKERLLEIYRPYAHQMAFYRKNR